MCHSDHDTTSRRSVIGSVMKRHANDTMTATMTAHDTISVIAQPVEDQRQAQDHDTMTLNYSKWGDKAKYGSEIEIQG